MEDPQIHGMIEQLVAEEHELWRRESAGTVNEADRDRLHNLRISLDQCWACSGSDARCVRPASIRTRQPLATRASSRATSSKSQATARFVRAATLGPMAQR